MLSLVRHNISNILFFNLVWFACVVGRADWLWATAVLLVVYLFINFPSSRQLLTLVTLPAAIGIAVDSLLIHFGVFIFPDSGNWMPLWLVALWFGFATTLTKSLAFFSRRTLLAAVAGLAGFPFSYLVGYKLGAVEFGYEPFMVAVLLAVVWAIMLPVLFRIVTWRGPRSYVAL